MDYFNYYSIVSLTAILVLSLFLAYIVWIMKYQNAGTPYPPTASTKCPDGWTINGTTCIIPSKTDTTNTNQGVIHADYAYFIKLLPGAMFSKLDTTTTPPTLTPVTVDGNKKPVITDADMAAGKIGVDMSKLDICVRKKWANEVKVNWDGVSNYNQC